MKTLRARLEKLEVKTADNNSFIVIDWGGPNLEVNGEELTREEFTRLYPDATRIDWDGEGGNNDDKSPA